MQISGKNVSFWWALVNVRICVLLAGVAASPQRQA
jgi:hypothetical protein